MRRRRAAAARRAPRARRSRTRAGSDRSVFPPSAFQRRQRRSTARRAPASRASRRARPVAMSTGDLPRWIASIGVSGKCRAQLRGDALVVDGDEPRRPHHDAQHRPEVVDRAAEPFYRVLDEVGARVRVVVPELTTVVVEPLAAGAVAGRAHGAALDRGRRRARGSGRGRPRCSRDAALLPSW